MKRIIALFVFLCLPHFAHAQSTQVECNKKQPFFIGQDIVASSLITCSSRRPTAKPATLSFSNDGISNSWQANTNFSVGIVLVQPGRPRGKGAAAGAWLADSALMAFARVAGQRTSAGVSTGFARFGLDYEALFLGNTLDYSLIDISPYYQTDLNGDASGYGLELNYTPVYGPKNVNALLVAGPNQSPVFFSTAIFRLDAYHSRKAGGTSLASRQDYAWVGGSFGAHLQFRKDEKDTIKLSIEVDAYHDVVTGQSAVLGSAWVTFPLNETATTAIEVSYSKGRPRQTLTKIDQAQIALAIKF